LAGVAVALIWQFILVQQVSFCWRDPMPAISYWLIPLQTDASSRVEVENVIVATSPPGRDGCLSINALELPWLNADTLSFYTAKRRLETNQLSYYTNLGYAATDSGEAWKRLVDSNLTFFITLAREKQPRPPDFLNQVTLAIQDRVENSREFVRQPFDSKLGIEIYHRLPQAAH
jgi:hypothetical protein